MDPKKIASALQVVVDRNPDMTIDQLRELVYKYMSINHDYDAIKMSVYETCFSKKNAEALVEQVQPSARSEANL
jgi:hypothetical protein